MGLLLKVAVHAANLQDRESVNLLLEPVQGQFPRMEKVWVDQGYSGTGKTWIEQHMKWTVEVVQRSPRRGWIMTEDQGLVWVTLPKTFEPLPRRWVVENTHSQYP
jgi:putative transposase